jgi:folate-dependent phosphoribosylglycinamide formyltransferase PurN
MKIAIIAPTDFAPHKYLCTEIARKFDLVAIFNPIRRSDTKRTRFQRLLSGLRRHGLLYYSMMKAASLDKPAIGWSRAHGMDRATEAFFGHIEKDFSLAAARMVENVDISSPTAVDLLSRPHPDIVICSGGPIYPKSMIEALPLILNYHTGISPIYNGSSSMFWVFANGQPQFSGGTLMKMNETVDGGDILAHYLPEIDENDDPAILFCKTIVGGVKLFHNILGDLQEGRPLHSIKQRKPLFYYRSSDWTVYQNISIRRHIENHVCRQFVRPEEFVEYWRMGTAECASGSLDAKLCQLLAQC